MHFFSKKPNRWAAVDQSFTSLFVTFSLIELANIGGGIIDGLIVSNFFEADALAAVGIANPMFSISGIISGLLATGMQTMCAQELGRGNLKSLNRLFSAVFYIGTVVSIVLMIAELLFAPQLAIMFGATGKGAVLKELAIDYIRGLAIGFPALVLSVVMSSGCQLDNGRKRVINATIIYAVSNILLDIVVAVLKLGLFGIGLATSLGVYIQLGYLLMHFKNKDRVLHFTKFQTNSKEIFELLTFGSEKALRRLANIISPILVNKIIIFYGGASAMMAMAVQKNLLDFAGFMAIGIADATSLQIGVLFGEKDDEAIREVGNCVHRKTGTFLVAVMLLFLLLSKPITSIYVAERDSLFDMTVFAVCMTGLYAPLCGLLRARIPYLQAVHKIKNMQVLVLLSSLVYLVTSAFVLGNFLELMVCLQLTLRVSPCHFCQYGYSML